MADSPVGENTFLKLKLPPAYVNEYTLHLTCIVMTPFCPE